MSGRVTLDRLRPADAPAIRDALRDWQVARWLSSVPWPYGVDDALDFITAAGPAEWAVRVDGQFAGMVHTGRDFSIWMAQPWQRRGLALRAAVLALSRVFAGGAAQISASHFEGNHRSVALLAKLGFRDAGPKQIPSRAEGMRLPGRRLLLTRATFGARHGLRLATPRLTIDGVRAADLNDLRRIGTDFAVARMLLRFHPAMSQDDLTALFPDETLVPPFRLVARQDNRVCGSIGIGAGKVPPIWYFLDPACAGAGLGTEMLRAFLDEVQLRYGLTRIEAQVFADNPASRCILEKTGFSVTGTTEMASAARNGPAPGLVMHWQAA
ncbi:MAG: GNAT family N-acetyltransferase [Paracoccus sp. (in: a-proteobacteria)]|uniref:GNAT family N-acetyltransferase n=1 Tax=Paracoccus sp. TaxID=267 RepID=UPI0026E06404|nr:GNAT family N-acetyltransferase [Paracoccus sp. (in: a-proteobacteria)]MDO5613967.1 GNAT family N-acetyltransferase [Paracoccus sp. (in: a-proteobacteria)]